MLESAGEEDAAGSPDEASGPAQTAFESFDDLIADAESEVEGASGRPADANRREAAEQEDAEASPQEMEPPATGRRKPAPPEPPASGSDPKKDKGSTPPRRRKISFV
jgi:hypothetical protein